MPVFRIASFDPSIRLFWLADKAEGTCCELTVQLAANTKTTVSKPLINSLAIIEVNTLGSRNAYLTNLANVPRCVATSR